jgi:hypothetical protein
MSTTIIIALIGAGLLLMAVIAVGMQQIEKNRAQRAELIAALRMRARSFQQLLEGFPDGFLSRDLKLLVCQCWYEGVEQLSRLDRNNAQIEPLRKQLLERMEQIKAQPANAPYQPLTNPAQMQEVQRLLNNLLNAVQKLGQAKRLNAAQTQHYSAQISDLVLRVGLDGHVTAAQEAIATGKPRLAVHHYQLAIDKMNKNNPEGTYTTQIAAFAGRIAALEAAENNVAETQPAETGGDAWKKFGEKDETWKKKSVYD